MVVHHIVPSPELYRKYLGIKALVQDLHALLVFQVHEVQLLDRSWIKEIFDSLKG